MVYIRIISALFLVFCINVNAQVKSFDLDIVSAIDLDCSVIQDDQKIKCDIYHLNSTYYFNVARRHETLTGTGLYNRIGLAAASGGLLLPILLFENVGAYKKTSMQETILDITTERQVSTHNIDIEYLYNGDLVGEISSVESFEVSYLGSGVYEFFIEDPINGLMSKKVFLFN